MMTIAEPQCGYGTATTLIRAAFTPRIILALLLLAVLGHESFGKSIFDGMGGTPDDATRLILGRVTKVILPAHRSDVQIAPPIEVTYETTVICEYPQRDIAEGDHIAISGRYGLPGKSPDIPQLAVDDVFLMAVRAGSGEHRFQYAGVFCLPIGVTTPSVIAAHDAAAVRVSLRQLENLRNATGGDTDDGSAHRQAVISLTTERNVYLWALAVTSLADSGTDDDARLLMGCYQQEGISPAQILWVEYCFEFVFPKASRPSLERRHSNLKGYLSRLGSSSPK